MPRSSTSAEDIAERLSQLNIKEDKKQEKPKEKSRKSSKRKEKVMHVSLKFNVDHWSSQPERIEPLLGMEYEGLNGNEVKSLLSLMEVTNTKLDEIGTMVPLNLSRLQPPTTNNDDISKLFPLPTMTKDELIAVLQWWLEMGGFAFDNHFRTPSKVDIQEELYVDISMVVSCLYAEKKKWMTMVKSTTECRRGDATYNQLLRAIQGDVDSSATELEAKISPYVLKQSQAKSLKSKSSKSSSQASVIEESSLSDSDVSDDFNYRSTNSQQLQGGGQFIPPSAIDTFNSEASIGERQKWFESFEYLVDSAGWDSNQCVKNLRRWCDQPTRAWIDSLSRNVKGSWRKLRAKFLCEYCRHKDPPAYRYHKSRQKSDQTPRYFFYQLTKLAKTADVKIDTAKGLQEHITLFIRGLLDSDLRKMLRLSTFTSLKEVEDMLKKLELAEDEESAASRKNKFPREKMFRAEEVAEMFARIQQDKRSSSAESSSDTDSELRSPDLNQYMYLVKQQQAQSSQGKTKSRSVCSKCKRSGHESKDCWMDIMCDLCGNVGHPARFCYRKCKECDTVHEKGGCLLREALKACWKWAQEGLRQEPCNVDNIKTFSPSSQSIPTSNVPPTSSAHCFVVLENDIHDAGYELKAGERRGWWKDHDPSTSSHSIALVHGSVCNHRVTTLLDSGASTSIISLDLARRLKLKLCYNERLTVQGVGGVTTNVTARAKIKITLGFRLVYFMEVWVGNIGGQIQCLLGMDFMVAAGVRLNLQAKNVGLPDEEYIPLYQPGSGNWRIPLQHDVVCRESKLLPIGEAVHIPVKYGKVDPKRLVLWVCRSTKWVATAVRNGKGIVTSIKVVNISGQALCYLQAHTRVAVWMESGEIPKSVTCAREGSPRYHEWETLLYEATVSRAHRRKMDDEWEIQEVQKLNKQVKSPDIVVKRILQRQAEMPIESIPSSSLITEECLAEGVKQVSFQVENVNADTKPGDVMIAKVEMTNRTTSGSIGEGVKSDDSTEARANEKVAQGNGVCENFPLVKSRDFTRSWRNVLSHYSKPRTLSEYLGLECRSMDDFNKLQMFMVLNVSSVEQFQNQLDGAVYYHESTDLVAEDLANQLAFI